MTNHSLHPPSTSVDASGAEPTSQKVYPAPVSIQSNTSSKALKEVLVYPVLVGHGASKRKTWKRDIPNFVNGPQAMKVLLDEKLKKARLVAEKQRKMQLKGRQRERERKC